MELTQENFDVLQKRISTLENQLNSNNEFSQVERLNESQAISQIGSWSWDVKSGDIRWSDMMFTILGLEPFVSIPSYELALKHVHTDDKVIYERSLAKAMSNGEEYYIENRITKEDQTIIHVISRGVCICNESNEVIRMIGTVQDVTLIKQLVDSNKQLERFAHILSHDFKTPLRNIISFIGLIKLSSFENLTENGRQHFSVIDSAARRLSELVNDLLDYSKLSSPKLEFEQVLIRELIDHTILDLDIILSANKGEITIGYLPTHIYGDKIKLGQVFQNLISNAIKYARNDHSPKISIYSEEKDGQLTIYVTDNGIGISKELTDKIFEPYTRIKNDRPFDGIGIGLSICKRIIKMHSGEIGCYTNKDLGSTFYFSLPI